MPHDHLLRANARFVNWIQHQALPFWASRGIESSTGGSWERVMLDGTPDRSAPRRVRVNARQTYSFCAAIDMQWMSTEQGLPVIAGLQRFVTTHAAQATYNGGFVHVLNADLSVADSRLDLYDCAFHLFAAAARYKVLHDPTALTFANQLMSLLDTQLKGPNGGWLEGDGEPKERRQNPHMHLFEAFLAWYEASQEPKWLARAGEMYALFEHVLFDHNRGVLLEFFEQDWTPAGKGRGELVEPGHMFEWVWLLRRYQYHTGCDTAHYCQRLLENGLKLGRINDTGLIVDQVNLQGDVTLASQRNWPLIELIKAYIAQAHYGVANAEEHAAKNIDLLFDAYITPAQPGLFFDQRDADNQLCSQFVPASILYHLILACQEVALYCQHGPSRSAG